jgi:AraC family transcriptional regulator, regulatory protein of adaptative response / methylated-DNA-[protein]-cysteine methyltransferase
MSDSAAFMDSRDFARIAAAIRFIETNYRAQPRLATIAKAVRLSEFHFNRLFHRWAGVTPRQYLAFITARAARGELANTPSVLEAAYALGLSGPGRLHDLLVTLDAVTPGELKARGRGLELTYGFSDTPFGEALLACTARGLSHLAFVEPGAERSAVEALSDSWPDAERVRDDSRLRSLARRIWPQDTAADAARPAAPVKLAVKGTNFQLKVWQALLELGSGGPTTYGALARAAGAAHSARAVGNAVGANPVAWLIPCHNVLRGDGRLGGYHWGVDRKRAMLAWQALRAPQARPAASAGAAGAASARAT